jgi:hypothetical protein
MPLNIPDPRDHRRFVNPGASTARIRDLMEVTAKHESGDEGYTAYTRNDVGQGISYGRFQFNQVQGNLGFVLKEMHRKDPKTFLDHTFGRGQDAKARLLFAQLSAANQSVRRRGELARRLNRPEWRARLQRLGREPAFQAVQDEVAARIYMTSAVRLARAFGLRSEKALALLFDMCIQHGDGGTRRMIERARRQHPRTFEQMRKASPATRPHAEHDVLVVVARASVQAVKQRWLKRLVVARREEILQSQTLSDRPCSPALLGGS